MSDQEPIPFEANDHWLDTGFEFIDLDAEMAKLFGVSKRIIDAPQKHVTAKEVRGE